MIRKDSNSGLKLAILAVALLISLPGIVRAQGCKTGAEALANVYVRLNPINAFFFGSVEDYVAQNRAHFVAGGDAVACARVMTQALAQGAFQAFDPSYQRRRDELNARLGTIGISPGPAEASPAAQLYSMAQKMDKLAYALPPAANGNYQPLWTPRNELEQMELFAMQMLGAMLQQDAGMRSVLMQMRPQIEELANVEYRMLLNMAQGL